MSNLLEPTPELSQALHENVVADQAASSLVSRLRGKNKELQTQSVDTYEQFWKGSEHNNGDARTS
ncbi:hypothetical protein IWQ57_003673, partial [Coemansia nantahalensis]